MCTLFDPPPLPLAFVSQNNFVCLIVLVSSKRQVQVAVSEAPHLGTYCIINDADCLQHLTTIMSAHECCERIWQKGKPYLDIVLVSMRSYRKMPAA